MRCQNDKISVDPPGTPRLIDKQSARGAAIGAYQHPGNSRTGHKICTSRDRLRPDTLIDRTLRAFVAASSAGAPLNARAPAAIRPRGNRVAPRPPVPTQPIGVSVDIGANLGSVGLVMSYRRVEGLIDVKSSIGV